MKMVKGQGASASRAQKRLLREAQAMAKLSHPNVVSIYDVGVVEGRVFLAMELITGVPLTYWATEKPRTWQAVRELFRQAAVKASPPLTSPASFTAISSPTTCSTFSPAPRATRWREGLRFNGGWRPGREHLSSRGRLSERAL